MLFCHINYQKWYTVVEPLDTALNTSVIVDASAYAVVSWLAVTSRCYSNYVITYSEISRNADDTHTVHLSINTTSLVFPTIPCSSYKVKLGLITLSDTLTMDEETTIFNTSTAGIVPNENIKVTKLSMVMKCIR